jgi:hypothetical protein
MALQLAPEQDLGVSEPVGPAPNWPARMKPQMLVPDEARLKAEHQLATLHNTDPAQTHIIIDRFQRGHELHAGQRREIDMLSTDIKYFQRQRRPNRLGSDGTLMPPHPIVVEGCRPTPEDVSPANTDAEVEAAMERNKPTLKMPNRP